MLRQRANTKEEDPAGLLNEGHRYRDLETGTWLSRDPAGFVDGPNLYAYVKQNPWSKFDPEGLSAEDDTTEPIILHQDDEGNGIGIRTDLKQVWKDVRADMSTLLDLAPGIDRVKSGAEFVVGTTLDGKPVNRALQAGSFAGKLVAGAVVAKVAKKLFDAVKKVGKTQQLKLK